MVHPRGGDGSRRGDADPLMTRSDKPERPHRTRAGALPWIGRLRRARADGLPASPRPTMRRVLRIAAGAVAALGVLALAAWLAILYMPLPASQVIPRVEAALKERLGPGYAVTIGDAELKRGERGVELRLVDLVVGKAGGRPIATVPRAELILDGMSLMSGDAKVRRVHVADPKLDLPFDMAAEEASKKSDLPDRILSAIGDLDRLLGKDGAAGALEEVEVTGATLLVAPGARAPLAFDGVNLRLSRGESGALALSASSAKADDRWTTAITVTAADGGGARTLDLGLENVDLAPYSAPFAEKAGAPPVKGRVSGHFNARIGAEATLVAGEARIDARGLDFTMPAGKAEEDKAPESIAVERLQMQMRWDAAARALRIEPSQVRGRGGQMTFTGALTAPAQAGKPWAIAVEGRDVLLSGESSGDTPLRLDKVAVAATFDPAAGLLDVSNAQFLGPTARAAATALVRFEGASPAIRLGLVGEPMPTSAVKRLWPFFLATSVRNWVVENIGAGTVDGLSMTIDVPSGVLATLGKHDPLPDRSLALDISLSDAVLRGSARMPWIEGAKGRVVASGHKVDVTIDRASISGGDTDGPLTVSDILFTVPDLKPRYPQARVTLKSEGSLRRALTLVGSGAFGANPLPAQLDVSKVSGRVLSDIAVDLELGHEDGKSPPPVVKATADMRDAKIQGIFAGRSFEKGSLVLKVGGGPQILTGKGMVGGAPAVVAITEQPATERAAAKRTLAVTLTADAADLTRLGLDTPGTLKGAVPLSADIMLDDPRAPVEVSADLTAVGIDGVVPGFKKPAGRAGKLGFVVDRGSDKTVIRDFALESGDRSVRGTIELSPKGELVAATFPIYRPGPGDDARVEIDKPKGGVTKIAVQGAALDLKPLLDKVRGKPSAGVSAPDPGDSANVPKNLDVTAKLGTGLGYGGEAVAGLDLRLMVRDGKVTDADGDGRVGDGPISFVTGADGRLAIKGGDAGAFFRFADLYGRIDGGAFDLNASLGGGPGVLRIQNFSVRNDTTLERVRRTTGADQNAPPAAAAAPTRFDRLQVNFVQSGGQLKVNEATVYGPQLGATLQGVVNYSADRVDLVGTFVPIYALNNLVARVPIIGQLLTGGKNGGLVGVTFQVKGSTNSPTVAVNPLSAVAPGFTRKIFEFRQQGGSDAPTGSTAPAAGAPTQQ